MAQGAFPVHVFQRLPLLPELDNPPAAAGLNEACPRLPEPSNREVRFPGRLLRHRPRLGGESHARRGCLCHVPPPLLGSFVPPGVASSQAACMPTSSAEGQYSSVTPSLPQPPKSPGRRSTTSRSAASSQPAKMRWAMLQAKLAAHDGGDGLLNFNFGPSTFDATVGPNVHADPSRGDRGSVASRRSTCGGRRYVASGALRSFLTRQKMPRDEAREGGQGPSCDQDPDQAPPADEGVSGAGAPRSAGRRISNGAISLHGQASSGSWPNSPDNAAASVGTRSMASMAFPGVAKLGGPSKLKTPLKEKIRRWEARYRQKKEDEQLRKKFNELPKEEADAIMQAFDSFDSDGSGFLTKAQVLGCLKELGLCGSNTTAKDEVLRICDEATARLERLRANSIKPEESTCPNQLAVDLWHFALVVVPRVRQQLSELNGDDMLRQFCHYDKEGTGKLLPAQCVEIARCMGIDQRLVWNKLEKRNASNASTKVDFEEFQRICAQVREQVQRTIRERERQIQQETGVSETTFEEFREDIVSLYEMFTKHAKDDNPWLSSQEVLTAMSECGILPKKVEDRQEVQRLIRFMSEVDGQRGSFNETFDFQEFLSIVRSVRQYFQIRKRAKQFRCFERYDRDKNGQLTMLEISSLLCDVGCVPRTRAEQEELAQLIQMTDADCSGFIDFNEFEVLSQRIEEKLKSVRYEEDVKYAAQCRFTEEHLRDFRWMFDSLDTDGSQRLDKKEVRTCLEMLGKHVADDVFDSVFRTLDADQSGELDFREYIDFMRLLRDGEGIFAQDAHILATQAKIVDTRILRSVLECFRFSKVYVRSLGRAELVDLFCECFQLCPSDNLRDKLHVHTVNDLIEAAKRRDTGQTQHSDKRAAQVEAQSFVHGRHLQPQNSAAGSELFLD